MSERARQLAHRRESLRLRAAAQRAELAYEIGLIQQRLGRVDQMLGALKRVGTKPLAIGAAVTAFAFLGPKRLLRWGARTALVANTARRLLKAFNK
jgi:hypothetical protein